MSTQSVFSTSRTCSTWGRKHFKTFDGDVYQFPGMCEYTLVSDCNNSPKEFSVDIKRKENEGNSTISFVVVDIKNIYSFNLSKDLVTLNDQR
uniref:VWFD domain-containing protein n=1 Tax=Oreochromis niloticus TaxID=8128 RepID=A0A669EY84_ORENI